MPGLYYPLTMESPTIPLTILSVNPPDKLAHFPAKRTGKSTKGVVRFGDKCFANFMSLNLPC
jgi:hypothetical protein